MSRKISRTLNGLIALNSVLLAILGLVTLAPNAGATGDANGADGDYIVVGGAINGATSNAVYVMEQRSSVVVGMIFDRSKKRLEGLAIRNVSADSRRTGPGR